MNTVLTQGVSNIKRLDGLNIKHTRMVRLFKTIHRLRWVTAEHVAILEYSNQLSSINSARKWLKKNLDDGYLIERQIIGFGRAFVLSKLAVDFMAPENESEIRSGKDWGKFNKGVWMPTQTWRHEYITNLFAATMLSQGHEIITEYEIRKANPKLKKIPDLLLYRYSVDLEQTVWHAVEVEQYRKSSKHMQAMVASLYRVAQGQSKLQAPSGAEIHLRQSVIVAMGNDTDERGYQLNHRSRILNAVDLYRDGLYKRLSFDVEYFELYPDLGVSSDCFLGYSTLEFNRGAKLLDWLEQSCGELFLYDFNVSPDGFSEIHRAFGGQTEMLLSVCGGHWRFIRRHYDANYSFTYDYEDEVLAEGKALTYQMASEEAIQRLKQQFRIYYDHSTPVDLELERALSALSVLR
ncbi:hypothetical protein [Hydromonas duriensis]|uniref:Uncharacterized protein n=1 Tax=Hydromonas duriensis TaxID=1527608 RepID=A0A4V6PY33_9BURK|nr:hypothetical protein [Hydromonas duriensis]TDR31056.1 hypothetical protein DFR44_1137 [Hydromonas duriensis]